MAIKKSKPRRKSKSRQKKQANQKTRSRKKNKARLLKALTVGGLGLLAGARVGIKMHNIWLHTFFTFALAILGFACTYYFLGDRKDKNDS